MIDLPEGEATSMRSTPSSRSAFGPIRCCVAAATGRRYSSSAATTGVTRSARAELADARYTNRGLVIALHEARRARFHRRGAHALRRRTHARLQTGQEAQALARELISTCRTPWRPEPWLGARPCTADMNPRDRCGAPAPWPPRLRTSALPTALHARLASGGCCRAMSGRCADGRPGAAFDTVIPGVTAGATRRAAPGRRASQSFSVAPACAAANRIEPLQSIRLTAKSSGQREGRQHHDAGEHRVHVQRALGLQDQIAHAAAPSPGTHPPPRPRRPGPPTCAGWRTPSWWPLGRYTWRSSWRRFAPSMRALSSSVGLTSRTPW